MAHFWFLYVSSQTMGPFTTDQVKSKVIEGRLPADAMIWWKGQRDWLPIAVWKDEMMEILDSVTHQTTASNWRIFVGGKEFGPFSQAQLLANLKVLPDLSSVMVLAEGMPEKKKLFEMHDVMELLGIDRREFERTPLLAEVKASRIGRSPKEFVLKAGGISKGGIGLMGSHDLKRGDSIKMLVTNPELGGTISLEGEVMFTTESFAGVRFGNLTAEARSIVVDYVKRFEIKPGAATAAPESLSTQAQRKSA